MYDIAEFRANAKPKQVSRLSNTRVLNVVHLCMRASQCTACCHFSGCLLQMIATSLTKLPLTFNDLCCNVSVSVHNNTYLAASQVDVVCRYGGALRLESPYVAVQQCTFENNTCTSNGGAVYVKSSNERKFLDQTATFSNCIFRNNTTNDFDGGGLYHLGGVGGGGEQLRVTDCIFENNNASSGGAMAHWDVQKIKIDRCQFTQNIAFHGRGGAIFTNGQLPTSHHYMHSQELDCAACHNHDGHIASKLMVHAYIAHCFSTYTLGNVIGCEIHVSHTLHLCCR